MNNKIDTILSLNGLTMIFGGLIAVNDFNFQLQDGDLAGLIGPNGAGKGRNGRCLMSTSSTAEGWC